MLSIRCPEAISHLEISNVHRPGSLVSMVRRVAPSSTVTLAAASDCTSASGTAALTFRQILEGSVDP